MLSTLVRILFGVDMALGCFNYVAWSWIAGQRFSACFLFLSIFSTHFPDADMIPYLLLRRRYRLVSHWIVGHHPLLLLPFVAVASFAAAKILMPDCVSYTVALITSGVLLHFLHDGASSLGFPWLSPFSQARFRFRNGKPIVVSQAETEQWMSYWKTRERSAAEEIAGRAAPVTISQFLFWGAGVLALIVFVIVL
jgi:LexA-binding, inner membrane-associated putative hydrolase